MSRDTLSKLARSASEGVLRTSLALRSGKSVVLPSCLVLLALAPFAAACPFCDGGPGGVNEVRAAIFGDDFWPTVGSLLLPFPIFLGIAALLHFAGRDDG